MLLTTLVPPPFYVSLPPQGDVERCGRTVYITNIDKKVDRLDVRSFFEQLCGEPFGLCRNLRPSVTS